MKLLEGKSVEKKDNIEKMLGYGTVMIFIDTRKSGVELPEQHKGNPQLPLNLDYAFQIPDFKILPDHIEASLSFNRQRFFCVIPFEAIYAMSSKVTGEALVYPDQLPKDIALFESPAKSEETQSSATEQAEKAPKFTVITNTDAAPTPAEEVKTQPKKGHLKLVE